MRFWLKAIVDFFEQLFLHTEADDLEGSLGASPSAPAPPAKPSQALSIEPDAEPLKGILGRERARRIAFFVAATNLKGTKRIRKAFQQYADEHIK